MADKTYSGNLADTEIKQEHFGERTQIKNLKGDLGVICNYCAGLGFTNTLAGRSLSCARCGGTGVEPVDSRHLQAQIDELRVVLMNVADMVAKKMK